MYNEVFKKYLSKDIMKVGSLVICVDDTNWAAEAYHYFDRLPVAGKTYRIRRIIENINVIGGPEGIALQEIWGQLNFYKTYDGRTVFEEAHFKKARFREIDEIEQKEQEAILDEYYC
jgi:hypothetical protein